jgi:hypothetical protein
MRACLVTGLVLALVPVAADAQESKLSADLRREGQEIREHCQGLTPKGLGSCAYALTTLSPIHVALGNLAPQNGFAFGVSFAERFTPNESWRLSWNADAVAAPSGSWRGGVYMKMIHTPETSGVVVAPPGTTPSPEPIGSRDIAVIDLFLQSTVLKSVGFFGLGPESREADGTFFGERQTSFGGAVLYPLGGLEMLRALRPTLVAGVNARFIDLRPGVSDGTPSIEEHFDDATAPGLDAQTAYVEFREAIRFKPSIANDGLRFNYLVSAQQFRTSSDSLASFNRWTLDLKHEVPLYRRVSSPGPRDFNGPNECGTAIGTASCPPVSWSRNRQGTFTFRLLMVTSDVAEGSRVPFYLQPTLGGADINGEHLLGSYQDYRFRAPHLLALQEGLEHSIWGPFGAFVLVEHGTVANRRADLDFTSLVSSATVGLTIRAGGFPMMSLAFSWGKEGHHITGAMASSLLGGSARPSLF